MKRVNLILFAVVLALTCVAQAAYSAETPNLDQQFLQTSTTTDDKPWYSVDNLSIAAGASYKWIRPEADVLDPAAEFVFGLYNAWQLTEHIDAIGTVEHGPESGRTSFSLGLRVILKQPN